MTNFERITASPETLGEFLSTLSIAVGPWDEQFRRQFCDSCGMENCDTPGCPYQTERSNPTRWLKQDEKSGEGTEVLVKIKAAFPIEWGRRYYTIANEKKTRRGPCICCDKDGKVTIKGVEYTCPRCRGNWRAAEVIAEETFYYVEVWVLEKIMITSTNDVIMSFKQITGDGRPSKRMDVLGCDFCDMVSRTFGKLTKVYNRFGAAIAEVERLNAAEREGQGSCHECE